MALALRTIVFLIVGLWHSSAVAGLDGEECVRRSDGSCAAAPSAGETDQTYLMQVKLRPDVKEDQRTVGASEGWNEIAAAKLNDILQTQLQGCDPLASVWNESAAATYRRAAAPYQNASDCMVSARAEAFIGNITGLSSLQVGSFAVTSFEGGWSAQQTAHVSGEVLAHSPVTMSASATAKANVSCGGSLGSFEAPLRISMAIEGIRLAVTGTLGVNIYQQSVVSSSLQVSTVAYGSFTMNCVPKGDIEEIAAALSTLCGGIDDSVTTHFKSEITQRINDAIKDI